VRRGPEEAPRLKSGIFDNPKMQGKPVLDLIQDTGTGSELWYIRDEPRLKSGTGAQMTAKSSIRNWGVLYKSGVYASKVTCLTLGDLYSVLYVRLRVEQSTLTAVQKSAEAIVGGMKQASIFGSMEEIGTRPVTERAGVGNS